MDGEKPTICNNCKTKTERKAKKLMIYFELEVYFWLCETRKMEVVVKNRLMEVHKCASHFSAMIIYFVCLYYPTI